MPGGAGPPPSVWRSRPAATRPPTETARLVLATAAGVVLGGGTGAADVAASGHAPARTDADSDPESPQGGSGPVARRASGRGARRPGRPAQAVSASPVQAAAPAPRRTTRAEILERARRWVDAKVPYSMEKHWSDGYRQDCSGYVSMAWNLGGNEWTGSLAEYGTRITREQLEPGDILLFHNPANPAKGSHVTIFGGWTDDSRTRYMAYELARPYARHKATPYAYWSNSSRYIPYRYKGVTGGDSRDAPAGTAYPGGELFGLGADNAYVTQLGRMLVGRGGERFYGEGPGPRWSEADRRATQAFQRAQGWRGAEADGLPGPHTWRLLVQNAGKDIPGAGDGDGTGATAFPGRGYFRPGQSTAYVEKLGRQLVSKGYGKHYAWGPGPHWSEADRRNVEAFQRAQGWRGAAADGYPGPRTWRRLFA